MNNSGRTEIHQDKERITRPGARDSIISDKGIGVGSQPVS